ncbi:O-antigen ligase family protein [Sulfurimonas sp.]
MSILKYFKNIRVLNHLQTIVIPALALYMLIDYDSRKRALITVALVLNFLLLLYTGARGTLYSVEAVFIFVFISNFNNKTSRNTIFITHLLFGTAVITYFLIPSISGGGHSGHISEISSNGRMFIYKTIIPMIFDPSYFIDAVGFSSQDLAVTHFLHPHNIFLYVFLGTGTFGLVSFICFTIYIIYKTLKQYIAKKSIKDRYLYAIFASPLIHSLVSGIYTTPLTSLLYLYFLFIFLKKYTFTASKGKDNTIIQTINIFAIAIIVLTTGISLKENIFQKKKYQYGKSEKIRTYHPGIMLYGDKIYTKGEKHKL